MRGGRAARRADASVGVAPGAARSSAAAAPAGPFPPSASGEDAVGGTSSGGMAGGPSAAPSDALSDGRGAATRPPSSPRGEAEGRGREGRAAADAPGVSGRAGSALLRVQLASRASRQGVHGVRWVLLEPLPAPSSVSAPAAWIEPGPRHLPGQALQSLLGWALILLMLSLALLVGWRWFGPPEAWRSVTGVLPAAATHATPPAPRPSAP